MGCGDSNGEGRERRGGLYSVERWWGSREFSGRGERVREETEIWKRTDASRESISYSSAIFIWVNFLHVSINIVNYRYIFIKFNFYILSL